jgi:hypothetical protein
MYSNPCNAVKIIANTIVINNPIIAPFRSPLIKAWCAQVTKAPLDRSRIVFSKGIAKIEAII